MGDPWEVPRPDAERRPVERSSRAGRRRAVTGAETEVTPLKHLETDEVLPPEWSNEVENLGFWWSVCCNSISSL